ncbi:MAG TPA: serine hydrolase domain-containing protein [Longimicrobiales bacterium]|nr:serine hydrolase domain-containing protein [Longimicrobiales bacterium]
MSRAHVWGWLVAGALIAVGSEAKGQDPLPRVSPDDVGLASEPLQRITQLLAESVAQERIAGAVVGVARHGRIAYLTPIGVQDIATGVPMSERSLFRVYSMTKAVTAVAVMMLHEEGRFELSDPVSRYLPEFAEVVVLEADGSTRPPRRPITIEHLLLHTAGLSHRSSQEYREANVRSRSISLDQFVSNVVRVPLRFDPGERYLYSASPTVLGRLVEVWSGMSFDEFLRERVLTPLAMHDTGFWVEPGATDRLTTVYAHSDAGGLRPFAIEEVPFTERPALLEGSVGLVSTVPDFLRFAQMLLNGGELGGARILSERTVREITRNGLADDILRTRRGGSGWALGNVSVVVDPASAGPGVRAGEFRWDGSAGTEFWVDPDTGTALVTMWQSAPANPDSLRQRITGLVRESIRP